MTESLRPYSKSNDIAKRIKEREKRLQATDEQFRLLLEESKQFIQTHGNPKPTATSSIKITKCAPPSDTSATVQTEELFKKYLMESPRMNNATDLLTSIAFESRLRYIHPEAIFEAFSKVVSRDKFVAIIGEVLEQIFPKLQFSDSTKHSLSTIYKTLAEGKAAVPPQELIGMVVLCGGPVKEKVSVAFNQISPDGSLKTSNLKEFLQAVFKILLGINPNLAKVAKVSISELAEMAAVQCFEDMECEELINVDTFVRWCNGEGIVKKVVDRVLVPIILNSSFDVGGAAKREEENIQTIDLDNEEVCIREENCRYRFTKR